MKYYIGIIYNVRMRTKRHSISVVWCSPYNDGGGVTVGGVSKYPLTFRMFLVYCEYKFQLGRKHEYMEHVSPVRVQGTFYW